MKRREFLTTAAATTAAGLLSGCNDSNRQAIDYSKHPEKRDVSEKNVNVNRNKKTKITLATSWPAHFPIMGTGVDRFAENVKKEFFHLDKLKGIILGGPGPAKEDFLKEGHLVTALQNKVIGVKDLGYADEHGIENFGVFFQSSRKAFSAGDPLGNIFDYIPEISGIALLCDDFYCIA